jgi:spermidine/putrescine transport system ATP-binding protein
LAEFLEFVDVSKRFGSIQAVDRVSVSVRRGEVFSLLGPSGCGKTTLLRMLAGFERPDSGRILLDGHDITDLPPHRRKVNTVFQSYALFPHLTVAANIGFGLKVAHRSRAYIRDAVERMLNLTQLGEHAHKYPGRLSGGQKQRVAIARALVLEPQVLLLDEPLAALDLKLRQHMLLELQRIHDEVGLTFLYVTHDQGEAMSLSERVAVMCEGRIEQTGTPAEVYEAPRTSFVAAFIGDTNFLEGTVLEVQSNQYLSLRVDGLAEITCYNDKQLRQGNEIFLSIRPEKFSLTRERPSLPHPHNVVQGTVDDVIYLGSHTRYWIRSGDHRLVVEQQHSRYLLDQQPITWGESVWISWHGDDGFMLEKFREQDELLVRADGGASLDDLTQVHGLDTGLDAEAVEEGGERGTP